MTGKQVFKSTIQLGGTPVGAVDGMAWRLQIGTAPFITVFTVHWSTWKQRLKKRRGVPLVLQITDGMSNTIEIKDVFILHATTSKDPHHVSFVVADKRIYWDRILVCRDYNVTRKTGDRQFDKTTVPVENQVPTDVYDFKPYSLKDGNRRWTAKECVEDVLEQIVGTVTRGKGKNKKVTKNWVIDSWPIKESGDAEGEMSIQNVLLRDGAATALGRLLSYIPGAAMYIAIDGKPTIFDASDFKASQTKLESLPPRTRDGDYPIIVDKKDFKPEKAIIHYTREVEMMVEYDDDFGSQTVSQPVRDDPYVECVIPTVDPVTKLTEYNPLTDQMETRNVPMGTWVEAKALLAAWEEDRSNLPNSDLISPYTFEVVKKMWMVGGLESVWGGGGKYDYDEDGNASARVAAFMANFRQTFRINPRYMERIRSLRAVRVGVLNPTTGQRGPSAAWGQACMIPNEKGKLHAHRRAFTGQEDDRHFIMRNVDFLSAAKKSTKNLVEFAPGPTRVSIVDEDMGIFRLEWVASPYGTTKSFVPCHLVGSNAQGTPRVPTRNTQDQDEQPMVLGAHTETGAPDILLRSTMEFKALVTIVPGAPNNKKQFYRKEIPAHAISKLLRTELNIEGGTGPDVEVFIPPGEVTARYAWFDDDLAKATLKLLLGTNDDDPNKAGLPEDDPDTEDFDESAMNGFTLVNGSRELAKHAEAVGVEVFTPYGDSVMGAAASRIPLNTRPIDLQGNCASITIRATPFPDAKIDIVHEFTGQQPVVSRFAGMAEDARRLILGIITYKE
jgi:hypothetical protein